MWEVQQQMLLFHTICTASLALDDLYCIVLFFFIWVTDIYCLYQDPSAQGRKIISKWQEGSLELLDMFVWGSEISFKEKKRKMESRNMSGPKFFFSDPVLLFSHYVSHLWLRNLLQTHAYGRRQKKKGVLSYMQSIWTHAEYMKIWNYKAAHFFLVAEVSKCARNGQCRANRIFFFFFLNQDTSCFHFAYFICCIGVYISG